MNRNKLAFIMAVLCLFSLRVLQAAPEAELIPFWNKSDENNEKQIDHSAWQTILEQYVHADHPSGVNLFNYQELKHNKADQDTLEAYLTQLQALDPRSYTQAVQKAYWINLYNALTVDLIIEHYPVKSIKKIGGLFSFGPWDESIATVAGQKLTLNNIEHGILRPIWQDNRIHYAVNCASYSCPNLAAQAYRADNTEQLLNQGAQAYVNHQRGVEFMDDDYLVLSSIYDWYQIDFGGSEAAVLKHLRQYAQPKRAQRLKHFDGSIDYEYDWRLNEP
ncbi:MAG: DUF547 domain-containing protein [Pseudomonadota bacterium]|nr:DUF547 domain-containing protein [Pseudomonadota bacterium]